MVTGGATRIGRAIALDLGRRGWAVAVHYHASGEAAEKLAGEVVPEPSTAIRARVGDARATQQRRFGADCREQRDTRQPDPTNDRENGQPLKYDPRIAVVRRHEPKGGNARRDGKPDDHEGQPDDRHQHRHDGPQKNSDPKTDKNIEPFSQHGSES